MERPILGFVGVGKVAQTLAMLWHERGYTIGGLYNRTPEKAQALSAQVGGVACVGMSDVVALCDIVFLTVSDDAIVTLAQHLSTGDVQGKAFVHTSGARDVEVLVALREAGAQVAGLHPSFPFADVATARRELIGGTFALETSYSQLEEQLQDLVQVIMGKVIKIPVGKKAQYHLALVLASNYAVTLYSLAQQLLLEIGANETDARAALNPLLEATVKNIVTQGIPTALTGPLTRADVGTLQSHLETIDNSEIRHLYRLLARLSYPMLRARNVPTELIEQLLREDENHASHHS